MRFISLFAGVGGFDLALTRLGHQCVYANEWDKYAAQIYEKNFSNRYQTAQRPETENIPRYGTDFELNHAQRAVQTYDFRERGIDTRSITDVPADELPEFDLLCGGFPCQSFSIAGKRRGFEDTRGTLFFDVARIIKARRPRLVFLENVKGLLSHDRGETFRTIIIALDELGYDVQWQVLNSRYFGVPQNRERVFIIGHLRGTPRPQVFPFGEGNPKPSAVRPEEKGRGAGIQDGYISPTLRQNYYKQHYENQYIALTERRTDEAKRIRRESMRQGKDWSPRRGKELMPRGDDMGNTLTANQSKEHFLTDGTGIRRLTPKECERLQGFPDNWTEGVSDTQRYKMMGNAVTVNVVYEIAKHL